MPVVIDQFEIVRDDRAPQGGGGGTRGAESAPAPAATAISPLDIEAALDRRRDRALRLRAD